MGPQSASYAYTLRWQCYCKAYSSNLPHPNYELLTKVYLLAPYIIDSTYGAKNKVHIKTYEDTLSCPFRQVITSCLFSH